jgi:hypothetical protein
MGANAQTTVPTFTAGDVLTAAQMNQSARTGVPVFADSSARDAAFGGTGEKTLAEGQLCYLEDSNIVQYYDGSSWATVGPSTPGGLVFIKSQTIGTTVSSVTVTDAFNSSYDNYLIKLEGGAASTSLVLRLTLGATNTGYYFAGPFVQYTATTVAGQNGNNQAYFECGYGHADGISVETVLGAPNLAQRTTFRSRGNGISTTGYYNAYGGFVNNTTQYTDFTITTSTGTMTGGVIRVYGYSNS